MFTQCGLLNYIKVPHCVISHTNPIDICLLIEMLQTRSLGFESKWYTCTFSAHHLNSLRCLASVSHTPSLACVKNKQLFYSLTDSLTHALNHSPTKCKIDV